MGEESTYAEGTNSHAKALGQKIAAIFPSEKQKWICVTDEGERKAELIRR